MKKIFQLALVMLFGAALGGCKESYGDRQEHSRAEMRERARRDSAALKIATVPTMDCLPLFVGVADSTFQRAGVDVRLRQHHAQIDGDTLLAGGYVEGAVTDLVRAERLQRLGTPLRYVAATNASWQIISNRLSRISSLKQLADKMIAMTRHSATDYLATLAIDSAKPQNDVYRIQINDVHIRLKMLVNNEMDAITVPEPQATAARQQRHPVLMDSRDKDIRLGVIAFRTQALRDKGRQKQLKVFLEVYNSICDSINRKGVAHYAPVICRYMGVDAKVIKALPKLYYSHAAAPRERDVARARAYSK